MIARVLLLLATPVAALFIARESPNFTLVQGAVVVIGIAALVLGAAVLRRR